MQVVWRQVSHNLMCYVDSRCCGVIYFFAAGSSGLGVSRRRNSRSAEILHYILSLFYANILKAMNLFLNKKIKKGQTSFNQLKKLPLFRREESPSLDLYAAGAVQMMWKK